MGTRGHEQGSEPVQHVRAAPCRRRPDRGSGRGRGTTRDRRYPPDEDRLATSEGGRGMRDQPLRGRSVRERRLAEKVAREWAERRATTAREAAAQAVDFDVAEVDREV